MNDQKKGFTLIELMMVVAIIGLLASVAIPKFANLIRQANEAVTKGNLGAMRSALSIYYSSNEGYYPSALGELKNQNYLGFTEAGTSAVPYEKVGDGPMPGNQVTDWNGWSKVGDLEAAAAQGGWNYWPDRGEVWVDEDGTDTKGEYYHQW
ncbi:MAG: type II secretion system protein [Elusimicrobia bacterium]|nr:type II secretion system protein [Elusimicrobiota bacterium]